MNTIEMRGESGANGSVSEMSFHHIELALCIALPPIKLNLLVFYCLEFALICSIPVDISNNAGVFKIYNGIVDEESGGGGRMEDIEVVIFDPRAIEVGSRMCLCMKGNGIFRVTPLVHPYDVSIYPNLSECDVLCYFILPILIEEDKGVLACITAIVLAPSCPWVVRVIKLFGKLGNIGDGTRCGREGDGRVVLSELEWFVALYIIVQHVAFNFVEDLRNEEEVFNGSVVTEGGGEDLVIKLSVSQDINC